MDSGSGTGVGTVESTLDLRQTDPMNFLRIRLSFFTLNYVIMAPS